MPLTLQEVLVRALKKLDDSSYQRFLEKLSVWKVREQYKNIPTDELTGKDPEHAAGLITEYYRYAYGAEVTLAVLEDIDEKKVLEELQLDLREVDISGHGLGTMMFTDRVNFIDRCQSDLIFWIKNVDPVLCDLRDQELLTQEQYNGVMTQTTTQEKMRELCDIIRDWDDTGKYLAYKSLTKYNELIMRHLEAADKSVIEGELEHLRMQECKAAQTLKEHKHRTELEETVEASQETEEPQKSLVKTTVEDISCKLCGKKVKDLADVISPIASGSLYLLDLKSPGLYRCQKTGIKFLVKDPVVIKYKLDSWSPHLKHLPDISYEILGPLFNIQIRGEPNAVSAVYLPHYLCLKGFNEDTSQIKCAHFRDGNMTLETPTQIEPYYITLENPSFSCLGPLLPCRKKKTPIHGIVLIYFRIMCKGDPDEEYKIHLYVLPYSTNAEEIFQKLDKENRKFGMDRIKKPEQTTKTVYTKINYLVTGEPKVSARPKTLKFDSQHYQFTEIRIKEKVIDIFLYVSEETTEDTVWDTHLTQNDVIDITQLVSHLTVQEALDGAFGETCVKVQKQQPLLSTPQVSVYHNPVAGASPLSEHFVDRHREDLIERTSHISPVLDNLLSQRLLTQEQYDTVRCIKPHQEAMRQLYTYMTSWGYSDKEKFYQALKKTNAPLIRDLEERKTIQL